MHWNKTSDLAINTGLPLCAGILLYAFPAMPLPAVIYNHLADGLWAYSFLSALQVIWDRNIPYYWVIAACIMAVSFEGMQYAGIVAGTADYLDLLTYVLFYALSLFTNQYIKQLYCLKKNAHA